MATVPRPLPLPTTPAVVGGRAATGARNIANVSGSPVGELNEGGGVQAESFAQQYHDFAYGRGDPHPQQHYTPDGRPRLDYGSGTDFIASFEVPDVGDEYGGGDPASKSRFLNHLSLATGIYERNSQAGLVDPNPRGETFNFKL